MKGELTRLFLYQAVNICIICSRCFCCKTGHFNMEVNGDWLKPQVTTWQTAVFGTFGFILLPQRLPLGLDRFIGWPILSYQSYRGYYRYLHLYILSDMHRYENIFYRMPERMISNCHEMNRNRIIWIICTRSKQCVTCVPYKYLSYLYFITNHASGGLYQHAYWTKVC